MNAGDRSDSVMTLHYSDIHTLNDHCDDVMQKILSFVDLKCSKLVSKQWHRLSALNESSQQRKANQMVRAYQSSFLSQIKNHFPSNHTILMDRQSRDNPTQNIEDIIQFQSRDGDRIMVPNGHYALNVDVIAHRSIIGQGDNVSFITSLTDLLVIRGSVYFENITFQNLRMVVYGDLFIKNCTFKFSSRSGRFTVWMLGGTLKYFGCEFAGINGIEMIDHGLSRNVDIVGCKFVSCGKRRGRRRSGSVSDNVRNGEGSMEDGVLNCIGNVFENNAVFPVMGMTRKVIGSGNILRGHNGFTMDQN